MLNDLLSRYNVPVPRYTSYPTVPYWKEHIDAGKWLSVFTDDYDRYNSVGGISLYIHLPFCESLCTYCGCNKRITKDHSVEEAYNRRILNEWQLYRDHMNTTPVIRELHLGGGTPTFFSPSALHTLLTGILDSCAIHADHDFSFEGHPNSTTIEHLHTLYDLGFRRVSFGVQDNDPEVQRIINRIQPLENVQRAISNARQIGYRSVNFDLIYGLPKQTVTSITQTISETIALRPDRVAFYSYAHVPWTSRGQRLFDESDLPTAKEKLAMYMIGKRLFSENGYIDIGMDHFALSADDLTKAYDSGALHRNFMGYTTQNTEILLGLGVSSISTTPGAYMQNHKTLHDYYETIDARQLPAAKGCFLTDEDRRFGRYIRSISCNGSATISKDDMETVKRYSAEQLRQMQEDGLIMLDDNNISVTAVGRNFVRNICSLFDLHLSKQRADHDKKVFSNSI